MEAINKTNGNIYSVEKNSGGLWYGYCKQTKEYTPAFVKLKNLCKFLRLKGYEIYEERFDPEEERCFGDVDF